jgi:hypothetical protein
LSNDDVGALATRLLDAGCLYSHSWGPDCERVHDIFDGVYVAAELRGEPYGEVETIWHEHESLDDALWFAVHGTYVEGGASALLAVSDDEWLTEIESRLADCDAWSDRLLAAEEEARRLRSPSGEVERPDAPR